jgi:hypothetical protein
LHYGLDFSAIRLGPYGGSHLLMLSFWGILWTS